jgi:methionyl-tRNA formyltransferase
MKIIFAGTPAFAVPALEALCRSMYEIRGVYTQPDRPAGRGQRLGESPVKTAALQHHLPIFQPSSLRDEQAQQTLRDLSPDVMVVAAYGLILPQAVLEIPRYGCINIHPSLLPRWRGATPIHRPLLNGEKETGVTIMQMDAGLDTGPMLYKIACPIENKDNFSTLHDKLARLGADSLCHVLTHIQNLSPEIQDESLACYAQKIHKTDAVLDFQKSAAKLDCQVRGFYPAYANLEGQRIKIWETTVIENMPEKNMPGAILRALSTGIEICTGKGILRVQKLQLPGGKILTAREILNAKANLFAIGKMFSTHAV